MKYQDTFGGSKSDLAAFIKKVIPELFSGKLNVEGQSVALPQDCDLECKVKYAQEEEGGSVTIKISWDTSREEEEVEEEELDLDAD